jgi:hypothetical protein
VRRRRQESSHSSHIGQAVTTLLRDSHLLQRAREQLCAVVWPKAVGDTVAAKCRVQRVRDGVAYIECESPAWAQSLSLQQRTVIKKVNDLLGAEAIASLRCSTETSRRPRSGGADAPAPAQPTARDLAHVALSAADQGLVQAATDLVEDRALRSQLRRALEAHLRRRRWLLQRGYRACRMCGSPFRGEGELCYTCRQEKGRNA